MKSRVCIMLASTRGAVHGGLVFTIYFKKDDCLCLFFPHFPLNILNHHIKLI